MAKFKVIAYSASASGKVYKAHQIVDSSKFTEEEKTYLVKNKFIREATDEEVKEHAKALAEKKKAEADAKDLV